ncbi:MAG: hypothetical protein FWH15_06425 [Betaproteobacteria bacterium]|nr:hypothetical protein [Betaproteobacteria bacterium]
MSNDINELREVLFGTLRSLKAGEMEPAQARAINDTAQTIINSAKVEIDHIRAVGIGASAFIEGDGAAHPSLPATPLPMLSGHPQPTRTGTKTVTKIAEGVTVTRHRMA